MTYRSFKTRYYGYFQLANSLWGIFCIFAIATMIGICSYWLGQPHFVYALTQADPIVFRVPESGGPYYPNVIISGVGRAKYKQWIEDEYGHIVHSYPMIELNSQHADIRHEKVIIPKLRPGYYTIKAEMINHPNPIKMTTIDLTLGFISVHKEVK